MNISYVSYQPNSYSNPRANNKNIAFGNNLSHASNEIAKVAEKATVGAAKKAARLARNLKRYTKPIQPHEMSMRDKKVLFNPDKAGFDAVLLEQQGFDLSKPMRVFYDYTDEGTFTVQQGFFKEKIREGLDCRLFLRKPNWF